MIFGAAMVFGSAGGVVLLYLFGWLWSWSGRKFGGVGDATAVRAAIAGIAVWLVLLAVIGPELFSNSSPRLGAGAPRGGLYTRALPPRLVLLWWSFILAFKCIGEAHWFSAWRALGAMVLGILVFVLSLIPIVIVALVFPHPGPGAPG